MAQMKASAKAGCDWSLHSLDSHGKTWNQEDIQVILLQEIRSELKRLNAVFACSRFQNIPNQLEHIAKHARRVNAAAKLRKAKK